MPGPWSDETRRTYLINKHGEEEGEKRYQAWRDERDAQTPATPQSGSLLPDEPKRKRTGKTAAKLPKVTQQEQHDTYVAAAGAIFTLDATLSMLSPAWREQHLEPEEIGAEYVAEALKRGFGGMTLAEATGDEVLNSDRLRKLFRGAASRGLHVKFAVVWASVMLPRLARAGMLPEQLGEMLNAAASMEGGGTHGGDRDDGQREVHPNEPSVGPHPQAFRGAQVESGQREVPESTDRHAGSNYGRRAAEPAGAAPDLRETA